MKRIAITIASLLLAVNAFCQTPTTTQQEYFAKYGRLVSKLGMDGMGIDTFLNQWEADYPDDADMLRARFAYCYVRSQSSAVTIHEGTKFLGQAPVLSLKDSLGNDVNYFQETIFDDEAFGSAITFLEKAIVASPERIDLRYDKINAYFNYEKESPDMATNDIMALVDYNKIASPKWMYGTEPLEAGQFDENIQAYCHELYQIGSEASLESFLKVSQKMNNLYPKNVVFLNNIAAYYLIKKDYKKATKSFKKVLKIDKTDTVALQNLIIIARRTQDQKAEKKYREQYNAIVAQNNK